MAFKKPCTFCGFGDGVHAIHCKNPDKALVVFFQRPGEFVPKFVKSIVDETRSLDPKKDSN